MRVRYASRIVTRVFTLLVMTASLATNARVSATLSGVFQERTGTLNDQPSSPRLLALRDRLTSGDRTALDKFWNEINEQGAPIIEPAAESDHDMLVTMLWRAKDETKSVFVFRLGDVSKPMVRLLDTDLRYKTFRFSHHHQTEQRKLIHANHKQYSLDRFGNNCRTKAHSLPDGE